MGSGFINLGFQSKHLFASRGWFKIWFKIWYGEFSIGQWRFAIESYFTELGSFASPSTLSSDSLAGGKKEVGDTAAMLQPKGAFPPKASLWDVSKSEGVPKLKVPPNYFPYLQQKEGVKNMDPTKNEGALAGRLVHLEDQLVNLQGQVMNQHDRLNVTSQMVHHLQSLEDTMERVQDRLKSVVETLSGLEARVNSSSFGMT